MTSRTSSEFTRGFPPRSVAPLQPAHSRSHRQHRSLRASGLVAVDPLVDDRWLPHRERVEQLLGVVGDEEHRPVLRAKTLHRRRRSKKVMSES